MKNLVPSHIAIIMDGNGRWAKNQGFKTRIRGHEVGVDALRNAAKYASKIGIKFLTVYAFSQENWRRPKTEVDALMSILVSSLNNEVQTLQSVYGSEFWFDLCSQVTGFENIFSFDGGYDSI